MISHVKNVTDETYFTEEANEKEGADRIAVNLELDNVQREVELLSEITKKLEGVEVSSATVANAIFLAIPLEKTKIDTAVFKLARSLKTLPECSGANGLELKPIVKVWHEMSKAFIEEGYFDDTWSSFLQGWKGVKIPL